MLLAPVSSVSPLPDITRTMDFPVTWSGQADADGSGIAGYDIYVSADGGSYVPWKQMVTETSAVFQEGQNGHSYSFYSQAIDQLGSRESPPVAADATTTIGDLPTTIIVSSNYPEGAVEGDAITFSAIVFADDFTAGVPTGSVQWLIDGAPVDSPRILSDANRVDLTVDLSAGAHNVVAHYTSNSPNFADGQSGSLTQFVNQPALIVSADNQWKVYGSENPALTGYISGLRNDDPITVSFSTEATSASAVGFYAIRPVVSDPTGQLSHYRLTVVEGQLSVAPAPLTIAVDNQIKVYGAAVPELTASYTGFVNGDTPASLSGPPTLATPATAASHVGNYPITLSGLVTPNYTLIYGEGTLTVTPAALTITVDDQTKVYGASLPELTASYSGLANGDTAHSLALPLTLTTPATAASHVGLYPITVSEASTPDYTIEFLGGVLTVEPAALTITVADETKVYGAPLPALTVSYSGFVNGDTAASVSVAPTPATTATAASHVGSYPIVAEGAWAADYTIGYVDGTLVVTPASLTVAADPQSKSYGASLPVLTASYSGFVNGDTAASLSVPPVLVTPATAVSHVGSYPIAVEGARAADYTIGYVDGTLVVTPAALTIVADSQRKSYGASLPVLTASYRGFVNGDTAASLIAAPSLVTAATAISHVGEYPITASGAVAADYALSYLSGSLTVTPAHVTIDQSVDQADPTNRAPIHFTAVFQEPVSEFSAENLALGGTAGGSLTVATSPLGGDGTTFDVAIDGMTGTGTVTVGPAAGNGDLLITSADDTVTYRPWQHVQNPADVNDQGGVTPLDVLLLINYINANGAGPLPSPPPSPGPPPYLDVDGDGEVTAQDVLAVINSLNNQNAIGTVQPEGESAPRQLRSPTATSSNSRAQVAASDTPAALVPASTPRASEMGGLATPAALPGGSSSLAQTAAAPSVAFPDLLPVPQPLAASQPPSAEWETLLDSLTEGGTRRGNRPDQVDLIFAELATDLAPA